MRHVIRVDVLFVPFQRLREAGLVAVCLVLIANLPSRSTCAQPPAGMLAKPPASGRAVQVTEGYMVPYVESLDQGKVTFEMVPIPGGTFLLGSPSSERDRREDEGPQVRLVVEPFWMSSYEVTWRQYRPFMDLYNIFKSRQPRLEITDDNRVDAFTVPTPLYEPEFTFGLGNHPDQPAVTMSQYAARQFTKWISQATGNFYRLPTEAEWEYACRAGSTTAYSFGEDPDELAEHAWYFDNSDDTYQKVGQKNPNAWDLFDMHGNVAELTLDQYAADGYQQRQDKGNAAEVVWPAKLHGHVIRGGAWDRDAEDLRSAARAATKDWRREDPNLPKSPWWFTDEESLAVGFRIVRPLRPPTREKQQRFWDAGVEYLQEDIDSRISEGRGVYGMVREP